VVLTRCTCFSAPVFRTRVLTPTPRLAELSDCWLKLVWCWVWGTGRLIYFVGFPHEAGTVHPDVSYVLDAEFCLRGMNVCRCLWCVWRVPKSRWMYASPDEQGVLQTADLWGGPEEGGLSSLEARTAVLWMYGSYVVTPVVSSAHLPSAQQRRPHQWNLNPSHTNKYMGLFRSGDRLHTFTSELQVYFWLFVTQIRR
jgi:hypothetical protein